MVSIWRWNENQWWLGSQPGMGNAYLVVLHKVVPENSSVCFINRYTATRGMRCVPSLVISYYDLENISTLLYYSNLEIIKLVCWITIHSFLVSDYPWRFRPTTNYIGIGNDACIFSFELTITKELENGIFITFAILIEAKHHKTCTMGSCAWVWEQSVVIAEQARVNCWCTLNFVAHTSTAWIKQSL